MRKTRFVLLTLLILALLTVGGVISSSAANNIDNNLTPVQDINVEQAETENNLTVLPKTEKAQDAIARLMADTNGSANVSLNKATDVASFIRLEAGSLPFSIANNTEQSAIEQANAFFNAYGAAFGIKDANRELELVSVKTNHLNAFQVSYQQVYNGVPVFAAILKVHFSANGDIFAVNGTFIPNLTLSSTPVLSAKDATKTALGIIGEQKEELNTLTTLYVFRDNLVQGIVGANHLAYEVEVTNNANIREFIYVDAHKGNVIEQFTGIHEIEREVSESSLANVIWDEGNGDPNPLPGGWAGGTAQQLIDWQNEVDGAGETYYVIGSLTAGAYISYDNNDAIMRTVNNDPNINCPNANWNGTSTNYCSGVTGDDTVAHEWGHAYTEYTNGLIYAWQSGALNESYSDIWGEVVDLLNGRGLDTPGGMRTDGQCSIYGQGTPSTDDTYRWLSGEDDPAFGGAIRDMWQPSCYGDPDKVLDANYWCTTGDGGGVHTNSGVPNHAFALMVDGGTFNGYTITAIGLTKASHIHWAAQNMLTPASNFVDHANALESSCSALIGVDLQELSTTTISTGPSGEVISQSDCDQVSAALLATEMWEDPTEQCGFEPMLDPNTPWMCPDLGMPNPILSEDWEAGPGSWAVGTRAVANPETFDTPDWAVVPNATNHPDNLPDGRPGSAMFVEDNPAYGNCADDTEAGVLYLESPAITIPITSPNAYVAFDHWVSTELGWDGGNVKVSTDGGATWMLVPSANFVFNAYPGSLNGGANDNPLGGEEAFTGGNGGSVGGSWGQSQVDLAGLAGPGDTVLLRFEMGLDGCNGVVGWYVDEVEAYSCTAGTPGVIEGHVLDIVTGEPVVNAMVEAGGFSTVTNMDGHYRLDVPNDTFTVMVDRYGYEHQMVTGITVGPDETQIVGIALTPLPNHLLEGYVFDENTGWPLYAQIDVMDDQGNGFTMWNDPTTGYYAFNLPSGRTYNLTVNAWVPGYIEEMRMIGPLANDMMEDFSLIVDVLTCEAPGYEGDIVVNPLILTEDFDAGIPGDWTVVNNGGDCTWVDNDPGGLGNLTGGTGIFAVADSDACGSGTTTDTELVTPVLDTTAADVLIIEYKNDYRDLGSTGVVEVFDGSNWVVVEDLSGTDARGPQTRFITTTVGSGIADAQVRWHYVAGWDWWWEVDDIRVYPATLTCDPAPGGLVVGNVYDSDTMLGLNGADVWTDGGMTVSGPTMDPFVEQGFYTLFSPAGSQSFTATLVGYNPASDVVTVVQSDTVMLDLYLDPMATGGPVIDVESDKVYSVQATNEVMTRSIMVKNIGSGDLIWDINEAGGTPAPPPIPLLPKSDSKEVVTSKLSGKAINGNSLTLNTNPVLNTNNATTAPQLLFPPDVILTHSLDQSIVAGSVACAAGGLHADNSYMRVFDLDAFGLTTGLNVTNVEFGIQTATGNGGSQPVTVNLYSLDGDFIFANLTLLGTADAVISDTNTSIFNVPIVASFPPGSMLVVELFTPDGQTDGNSFYVGSNNLGQTAPSYLAAAACGITEPMDTADIGFPDMHVVMNVLGNRPTCENIAADISWVTNINPISGTNAGGTGTMVDVVLDSSGLTTGTYTGTLCVDSNDLANSMLNVPIQLEVGLTPAPNLVLNKTVSTDGTCGVSNDIVVASSAEVTYCYTVENTGNVGFNYHYLWDDTLGDIYESMDVLLPGETWMQMTTAWITETTVNSATWLAEYDLMELAEASAMATVTVAYPEAVLTKTVSLDGSCGDVNELAVAGAADVTYCYALENTGEVTFDAGWLWDDALGLLGGGLAPSAIGPGDVVMMTTTVALTQTTLNHALWYVNDSVLSPPIFAYDWDWANVMIVNPALDLTKTVSTDGSCGDTNDITVNGETDVTYCYTAENTGDMPFTYHMLYDDVLGTLYTSTVEMLPGEVWTITETVWLTETTVNSATWYADMDQFSVMSSDMATVTVVYPDLTVEKTVMGEGGSTTDLAVGSVVTYTLDVSNAGDGAAYNVMLTDTLPSGVTFGGFVDQGSAMLPSPITWGPYDVESGMSYSIVFTATIDEGTDGETITNTVWYDSDGAGSGSADAMFTVVAAVLNNAPVAVDDTATTSEDTSVTVDVLANDTDADNDTLTVDAVGSASNGTVVNNSTDVTYTPNAAFSGTDTFTYTVSDGNGGFDTATVTITVEPASTAVYSVQVAAPVAALSGDAGTSVTYTVWVTNTGNTTDTFDLTDNSGGSASLPTTVGPLAASASISIEVVFNIPATATDSQQFVTTVTATSQGDNTVSDSVDLTTTAIVGSVDIGKTVYLPIVFK